MELREWTMYKYASNRLVKTRDWKALKAGKENRQLGPKGSKYTILSISLGDGDLTWCFGPGISTIFITKNEFPSDLCVLSRRHFP